MENLYIETKNGRTPIDPELVKKFNLEKGSLTPFTRSPIVGENGDFPPETATEKDPKNSGLKLPEPDAQESVMLETSEVIDFAQGTDSHTGG